MRNLITYSVLRCVDERRDEALNVGVLALDPLTKLASVRLTEDLSRVSRALPNVPVKHLQHYLQTLPHFFHGGGRELTPADLDRMSREWGNGVRLSPPRSLSSPNIDQALRELFERYVEVRASPEADIQVVPEATISATSRRVAKSIVSSLRKRGFEERRDFDTNAKVIGLTRQRTQVPVWYPIRVAKELLIDAMEISPTDERRSVDNARLLAAKADEVLRANGYRVAFVVRPGPKEELNALVRTLLIEEGTQDSGRHPEVHWQTEMDSFITQIPPGQYRLPGSE